MTDPSGVNETDPNGVNEALDRAREVERQDRDTEIDEELDQGARLGDALRADRGKNRG